ncbi:MAG: TIGR04086 family membrane protein [Firmicutes bacterium]|nr:TIGR04086 family membrane protein [Bacillota bacterium]
MTGPMAQFLFRNRTVIWGVIRGLLLSIIISLVLLLACSLVLHLTALPERVTPYLACGLSLLAVLCGSYYTGKRVGFRGWLLGGVVGVLYVVGLLLAGVLVGNNVTLGLNVISKLFLGFMFGAAGGMWGVNS